MVRRWQTSEEDALKQIEDTCIRSQKMHERCGAVKWRWHFLMSGAIAVLSLAAGAINFSTPEDRQTQPVKFSVGAVNLCAAGITWLAAKVDMGKRVESHRAAGRAYAILVRNIRLELSTPRRERTISGATYLHICMEQMNKILEEAPQLPDEAPPAVTMQLS